MSNVKTFGCKTFTSGNIHSGDDNLDEQINSWVHETKNIIATVGPLSNTPSGYSISVTYVSKIHDVAVQDDVAKQLREENKRLRGLLKEALESPLYSSVWERIQKEVSDEI